MKRIVPYLVMAALPLAACHNNNHSTNQGQTPTEFVWDNTTPLLTGQRVDEVRGNITKDDDPSLEEYTMSARIENNLGQREATHAEMAQELDFSATSLEATVNGIEAPSGNTIVTFATKTAEHSPALRIGSTGAALTLDGPFQVVGQPYELVGAEYNPQTTAVELRFVRAGAVATQNKDEPVTYRINGQEFTINVVGVNSAETRVALDVNGTFQVIDTNTIRHVSGVYIGAAELAHDSFGTDRAEIYVGAGALTLRDNDTEDGTETSGGVDIDLTNVPNVDALIEFRRSQPFPATSVTLQHIEITYKTPVDVRIAPGEDLRSKIIAPAGVLFENWNLLYNGQRADGSHEIVYKGK